MAAQQACLPSARLLQSVESEWAVQVRPWVLCCQPSPWCSLAEWGDKSFLATIALAAASSPTGVVLGAVGGHGVATGIAVVGGSYLSRFLSEKVVAYVGGVAFPGVCRIHHI